METQETAWKLTKVDELYIMQSVQIYFRLEPIFSVDSFHLRI